MKLENQFALTCFIWVFITIALLFFPLTCHSQDLDGWDKAGMITLWSLFAVDCKQTIDIMDNPHTYEKNPILKSIGKDYVIPYFAVCGGIVYILAKRLDSIPRKIMIGSLIAIQTYTVYQNEKLVGIDVIKIKW